MKGRKEDREDISVQTTQPNRDAAARRLHQVKVIQRASTSTRTVPTRADRDLPRRATKRRESRVQSSVGVWRVSRWTISPHANVRCVPEPKSRTAILARCCPHHSVAAVVEPDLRGARRKQPARPSCRCEPRVRSSSALYKCGMCLFCQVEPLPPPFASSSSSLLSVPLPEHCNVTTPMPSLVTHFHPIPCSLSGSKQGRFI